MAANIISAIRAIHVVRRVQELRNEQNERRWWVRPANQHRTTEGFYETAYPLMREKDPEYFFRCTRMSPNIFDTLLGKIRHRLEKNSIRTPISPECRLFLTLM